MRTTFWFALLSFSVVACLGCADHPRPKPARVAVVSSARAADQPAPAAKEARDKSHTPDEAKPKAAGRGVELPAAVGFGVTEDEALLDARENARKIVVDYLAREYGETEFKPSQAEVNTFVDASAPEVADHTMQDGTRMKKVTLPLKVTAENVKKMRAEAREERKTERQHWLALCLAGVVSLLLVGGGYLRLEEATKGYYTGLLRLTALGVLALIGVAIWMLH